MAQHEEKKRRVRGAIGRSTMRVPFVRRLYVRRLLKIIDKSREKGRRLPPDLYELSKRLDRVPKSERAALLEQGFKADREGMTGVNREQRRSAAAQSRQGGKYPGRSGPPPRSGQRKASGKRR
jgi:hypothetical protein